MKQLIPFSKEFRFKTTIGEITSISLEHTLTHNNTYNILGDFIVAGTYKMNINSEIEEDFEYKIPVDIDVDTKYDVSKLNIFIDDFYYEIINEEVLKVNVKLCLDNLEEKEIEIKKEEMPNPKEEDAIREDNIKIEMLDDVTKEETLITTPTANNYKCYLVYIVRENDTLESIMDKYDICKEELCKYNNLDEYKLGMKLIIPSNNEQ
ncbi:MAG: LysM peptidoglycan-binding domain-containing protein [Bacilli bacterium]